MNSSNNSVSLLTTNSSIQYSVLNWTPNVIFMTVLTPCAALLNILILYIFATTHSLRSAFNVYIINLLLADFLMSVLVYPLDVVNDLGRTWLDTKHICYIYLYLGWMLHGCSLSAHALLGVNRLWAVLYPFHYRQHQLRNIKMSIGICTVAFIYVNIFVIPGVIVDVLRRPSNTTQLCVASFADQQILAIVQQVLVYDLFWIFLFVAVPVIWWKRSALRHNRSRTHAGRKDSAMTADVRSAEKERGHFKVGLVITIATLICWTPLRIYFLLDLLGGYSTERLFQIGVVLSSLAMMLDPILFLVMMPEIRTRIRAWLHFSNLVSTT